MIRILFLTLVYFCSLGVLATDAQAIALNSDGMAEVCEVLNKDWIDRSKVALQGVDFDNTQCSIQKLESINPQNKMLWIRIKFDVDPHELKKRHPLGLFISGKTSSEIYINEQYIGSNGKPAMNENHEKPGLIDVVFSVPSELLDQVENEAVVLLSAHHGFLQLSRPFHGIYLGKYQDPTNQILRHYWPSFLPFGVLILGVFFLTMMAWLNKMPAPILLLPLMALFVVIQLFVEVYRGLVSYPYPDHDWRLLAILLCSLGFGLSLLAYVFSLIKLNHKLTHFLSNAVLILVAVILITGFDFKSILAIVLPVLIATIYAWIAWMKGQKNMRFISNMMLVFIVMIVLSAYTFIDTAYYYFVAALIFMLMAKQAKQASHLKQQLRKDQARANHLQQVIDQQQTHDSSDQLEIRSAGKVEWVLIREIAYCKGAGDYVELMQINGQSKLYHGSITELSLRLPSIFLQTHRSYLVNTTLIKSLERNQSGAGQLHLKQGIMVPVSRRILPQLKQTLS